MIGISLVSAKGKLSTATEASKLKLKEFIELFQTVENMPVLSKVKTYAIGCAGSMADFGVSSSKSSIERRRRRAQAVMEAGVAKADEAKHLTVVTVDTVKVAVENEV